jgi:hypothetical protein
MILDPAKTHRIGLRTGTRRSHWAARFQLSLAATAVGYCLPAGFGPSAIPTGPRRRESEFFCQMARQSL